MKNFDSFSSDILTDEELRFVKGGGGPPADCEMVIDFEDGY